MITNFLNRLSYLYLNLFNLRRCFSLNDSVLQVNSLLCLSSDHYIFFVLFLFQIFQIVSEYISICQIKCSLTLRINGDMSHRTVYTYAQMLHDKKISYVTHIKILDWARSCDMRKKNYSNIPNIQKVKYGFCFLSI